MNRWRLRQGALWLIVVTLALPVLLTGSLVYDGNVRQPAQASGQSEGENAPLLLFEIDEGIGPSGLLNTYGHDWTHLDTVLNNVYDSLIDLTASYPVAVLIYPQHQYDRLAFGKPDPTALDRISDTLRHTFDFFQSKGGSIQIYLEAYSSGIYKNQNGQVASLPYPPLHVVPEDEGRPGLSMDAEAIAALKAAYPGVFGGLRFHEIFGGVLARAEGSNSGFVLEPEVVEGLVDVAKEEGLRIIWSDASWIRQLDGTPIYQKEPYASMLAYADAQLQEDMAYLWANNHIQFQWNFQYYDPYYPSWSDFPLKNRGTQWGMSIQSWFWHELMRVSSGRYYPLGETLMPVEVMGTYALKGLKDGADVLQFEPPWYLFNMEVYQSGVSPSPSNYEVAPDYSGRLALKRLKQYLLHPELPQHPPDVFSAYFDTDLTKLRVNAASNPPNMYNQTTVGLLASNGEHEYYDFYNDGRTLMPQHENRFRTELFQGDVVGVQRMELQGDAIDELVVLKRDGKGRSRSSFTTPTADIIQKDSVIAADNQEGAFVALATANLLREVVGKGDPDEIVILRENGGVLVPTIYEVASAANDWSSFTLRALPQAVTDTLLSGTYDFSPPNAAAFRGMAGYRSTVTKDTYELRNTDHLLLLSQQSGQLHLEMKGQGQTNSVSVPWSDTDPSSVRLLAADLDTDRVDEALLVLHGANETDIAAYEYDGSEFAWAATETVEAPDANRSFGHVFALRKTVPLNTPALSEYWYRGQELNGRFIRASMSEPAGFGNTANRAIDGVYSTYAQTQAKLPWDLTIDLGVSSVLSQVRFEPGQSVYATRFKIKVSSDLAVWTEVADETDGKGVSKLYSFPAVTARYVKIDVEDSFGSIGHSIREVGFPDAVPAP